jgi:hypothetical protein
VALFFDWMGMSEFDDDGPLQERTHRVTAPATAARLTPEEAGKLIRFALSELAAENAHHDFEHLCRHLTRRKICPNIIPATGPVSGGGDQGADFETYKVAEITVNEVSAPRFFSKAVTEKWGSPVP